MEKERPSNIKLTDIDIFIDNNKNILWSIEYLNENELDEDVSSYFENKKRHLVYPDEYIRKDFLDLFVIKLENWEKFYVWREYKKFWDWEIEDFFYIYEKDISNTKIWHWVLVVPLWKKRWANNYVWFNRTCEGFEKNDIEQEGYI